MNKMACAAAFVALILVSACATHDAQDRVAVPQLPELSDFSAGRPGDELPGGWRVWTMSRFKKPTQYRLVADAGRTVVHAQADASASGLIHDVSINPREFPILKWRWKTAALIPGADNRQSQTEDSPLRVMVAFEGDTAKLDFDERLFFSQVRMLTGQQMPYATLMYIWAARAPKGTLIPNRHTSRIRMLVVESGSERVGAWQEQLHNVYEDYKRAFGEEPPRIVSVSIMTDTDNTGEKASSYYGDIEFLRGLPAARTQTPSE
jgi:hypothetical protein